MLSPAVPLVITLCLIDYNFAHSNSNVFAGAPCLFAFAFGIVLAKVSILLLVSFKSKFWLIMFTCISGRFCSFKGCFSLYRWNFSLFVSSQAELIDKRQRKICAAREKNPPSGKQP